MKYLVTMNIIPTRVHGVLDYVVGIALITALWLSDFLDKATVDSNPKEMVPIFLGAAIILYSLFTDYEWGVARKLPMVAYLWLDFVRRPVAGFFPLVIRFFPRCISVTFYYQYT